MSNGQLTLEGNVVPLPLPAPKRLTERQRELLHVLAASGRPMVTADVRRFYVDASGAMRRLAAVGLVRRVGRGRWEPV